VARNARRDRSQSCPDQPQYRFWSTGGAIRLNSGRGPDCDRSRPSHAGPLAANAIKLSANLDLRAEPLPPLQLTNRLSLTLFTRPSIKNVDQMLEPP